MIIRYSIYFCKVNQAFQREKEYSLTIKGNVAMDCKPAGKRYPFFIHPEYNSARVPQKTKTMFVPKRLPFLDGAVKVKTITKEQ